MYDQKEEQREKQEHFVEYLAYGSNLLSERIKIGNPSAKEPRLGILKGFRLAFQGYSSRWNGGTANIVPEDNSVVLGVVWKIKAEDIAHLDAQEFGYRPITVNVRVDDKIVQCRTYVQIVSGESTKPSLAYKTIMLKGAIEHNMEVDYIESLRQISDNGVNKCALQSLTPIIST
ncbi:gamma-glutamylcyclotransferase-like protein [Leptotrombidium deliense]|uniref:gamma-glutamylcyclotransferase n=1 Tax=Leptotrombidium deliense TaxID=299467 RepID=A0A443S8D3_9ACAR|nr:gamma-glutamylcyclotransferase-like protein [Leptotrombidium deliense]